MISRGRDLLVALWAAKRYWLVPAVVALLLLIAIVVASERTPVRPFVYPNF